MVTKQTGVVDIIILSTHWFLFQLMFWFVACHKYIIQVDEDI